MPHDHDTPRKRPGRTSTRRADARRGDGKRRRSGIILRTDVPKRVDDALLGPYETAYDVTDGYAIERIIIQP